MSRMRTLPRDDDVEAFMAGIPNAQRRAECPESTALKRRIKASLRS